ncbi:hypothetical protein FGSG_08734 [Fusarium graminearum PH-1]|uniref:Chromosome 2, complete genome n=1 Tax=Gibberella zeae (strain ATCC MYA-4620 / CBS 123657 / FGSC 9075 / NRRL 31084 / PH-1) TaxID=229533 RepID=I1RWQ4_GIBZE|nr:hypothetical protein FGSG_08734 [Fusarium graminearum PH-1]ESU14570.1 hypothetical protein FGSG_08734 [Fusarium graminearum PH-1]CEF77148.1 unnamed protein product [Fusarium graminearum]|eukprot:XP_011319995.1 hypothetical protein FGSG_08734 [Fusarium graminearum PH-1]
MSLTGNGPTQSQVPATTLWPPWAVDRTRFLQARPLSHLVPTYQGTKLKASSEQPLFRSSQPHKAIHSFSLHSEPVNNTLLVTSFFLTHTIYCEIETSVDLLLMTANMSANRQVSGGYKHEPALHPTLVTASSEGWTLSEDSGNTRLLTYPCNIPVASLTSSGVPRWTRQGIFCFTMTGARPPAGNRGGVARLASFDRGIHVEPPKIGEEKRRDVAAHSNRSLDINHIDAQRHCMHQPHRFTGTTNGDKTTTKAINRLRRFNDLIQPLKSIRFWVFGYNSNATEVKLDSHPPNGCEAGDERASVRLPMNAHYTTQPKSRQRAAATRTSSRWMMPEKDAERDA